MTQEIELWLRFNPEAKAFEEMRLNNVTIPIMLGTSIPNEILSKLQFLYNYSKEPGVKEEELERLINFMLVKEEPASPKPICSPAPTQSDGAMTEEVASEQPGNLRRVAYDWVKRELETNHRVDLDGLTEKIVQGSNSQVNRESVRGSVSSTLSALRNAFPGLVVKAWNEPTWRGKSTGRNPSIEVKSDFVMPDYALLWDGYSKYLKHRKLK